MAAYLLLGSFLPKGDYTQLLRLMDLGHHFHLHVQEAWESDREISFREFFQMHYLNTQLHQGDHEQDHEKLPFQHITPTIDQIVPPAWQMIQLTLPKLSQTPPGSVCSLISSTLVDNIFHPPIA